MKHTLLNMSVMVALKQIPDESVDCVVSSPPYYGLRSYIGAETVWGGNPECEHDFVDGEKSGLLHDNRNGVGSTILNNNERRQKIHEKSNNTHYQICSKCNAWKGQLGLEPTYQLYVEHLMLVMTELKRVLKKTGTLFWNMGDSYASSGSSNRHFGYPDPKWDKARDGSFEEPTAFDQGIKPKSLMGIPERFMLAMLDDEWVLRNKLPWIKVNAMPSSKKDGFTPKWEYVYFFTKKSKSYYFDLDSIRKPLAESSIKRISRENIPNQFQEGKSADFAETDPVNNIPKILNNMHKEYSGVYSNLTSEESEKYGSPRARNMRNKYMDVTVSEKPYAIAERDKDYVEYRNLPPLEEVADFLNKYRKEMGYTIDEIEYRMNSQSPHHWFNAESYPNSDDWKRIKDILTVFPETLVNPLIKAGCPLDGVVLDPFAGSGTIGVVAQRLGRSSILIEISPEYCNIIKKRLNWGAGLDVEYDEFPKETLK